MISRQKLITLLLFLVAGISTAQSFDFKQLSETTNEQAQNEINQALTNLDFIEAVENWYENKKDKYTGPTYIIKHETGKDIVAVATTIGTGGLAGATKITKGVDLLKEVVERVKKVDVGGLTELIAQVKAKFPEEWMNVWDDFAADFGDNTELLKLFKEKPELVGAWKKAFEAKVRDVIRINPDFLTKVNEALQNGLDWQDALDDAIQTFQKAKPTWPEIRALFKRGNDFNKKAAKNDWYPFNEIHLSNGKRLDSYNALKGEIVSRKATDLNNIQKSTFVRYLKELNNKYLVGTIIRSNKYPQIDGQQLMGKQILEIPESNKSFSKLQEYIDLANEYNIEIRFRPE